MRVADRSSIVLRSTTRLKKAPAARPAGFQNTAEASSATAVNAPPMPAARTPAAGSAWAAARDGESGTNDRVRRTAIAAGRMGSAYPNPTLSDTLREGWNVPSRNISAAPVVLRRGTIARSRTVRPGRFTHLGHHYEQPSGRGRSDDRTEESLRAFHRCHHI